MAAQYQPHPHEEHEMKNNPFGPASSPTPPVLQKNSMGLARPLDPAQVKAKRQPKTTVSFLAGHMDAVSYRPDAAPPPTPAEEYAASLAARLAIRSTAEKAIIIALHDAQREAANEPVELRDADALARLAGCHRDGLTVVLSNLQHNGVIVRSTSPSGRSLYGLKTEG